MATMAATCDNQMEVWLDGQKVSNVDHANDWTKSAHIPIPTGKVINIAVQRSSSHNCVHTEIHAIGHDPVE